MKRKECGERRRVVKYGKIKGGKVVKGRGG